MKHLIEVFYKGNVNSSIRVQFLTELENFLENNHMSVDVSRIVRQLKTFYLYSPYICFQSFWVKVASSYFIQSDLNSSELANSVDFLLYLAKKTNSPKHLNEIIGILEKVNK